MRQDHVPLRPSTAALAVTSPLPRLLLAVLAAAVIAANTSGCHEKTPPMAGGLFINHPVPLRWTELEKGLQYTRLEFTRQADGRKIIVAVLGVDPHWFKFSLLSAPESEGRPAAWVGDMAKKAGAVAAVNASFFLATYEPIGLLVSGGKVLHPWHPAAGSGVFWYDRSSAGVEWAREYRPAWEHYQLAVQSNPLVVEPRGRQGIYQDAQKYRARTAVGVDKKGRVIVLCTFRQGEDGQELSGLDLYELMEIARLAPRKGGLGLEAVLNFDGGTSSALFLAHPRLKLDIKSANPVVNAVAIFKNQR